ncbi:FG-GAP-like repeat-containing protein [Pelagibacterium halotolerans]|uniref:FG-GAP-like repeat-containing protein n=1 Tax=Pelagibacterium halotolerans TaxID=531813 RepID=UPI00384FD89A
MKIQIVDAATGQMRTVGPDLANGAVLDVGDAARVAFDFPADAVAIYERVGDALVVVLTSGETVLLEDFFREDADGRPVLEVAGDAGGAPVEVVFDTAGQGVLAPAFVEGGADAVGTAGMGTEAMAGLALGGLAVVGAGAALAGGGGSSDGGSPPDTTPPAAPAGLTLDVGSDTGPSDSDGITSDTTPTLTGAAGSVEAGATVTIYDTDGMTVVGTGVAEADGSWSITTSALAEGVHTLTAKATDAAGNVSAASDALSVTVDTTAPGVPEVAAFLEPFFKSDTIEGDTAGAHRDVAMGDVDGNGHLDIYVANEDGQNQLWLGLGGGKFKLVEIEGDTGASAGAVIADINGDNHLDIYVANRDGQNRLWYGDGKGSFTKGDIENDIAGSNGATVGDVDGNGLLDIYVANEGQNLLWLNYGETGFAPGPVGQPNSFSNDAAMADVDGDGDLDIYVANAGKDLLLLGDGKGGFSESTAFDDTAPLPSSSVVLRDVNGDNAVDAFVTNRAGQNHLLLGDGKGGFKETVDIGGPTGASTDAAIDDVNGDGFLDIYVANNDSRDELWLGDGKGGFTLDPADWGNVIMWEQGASNAAALGDVDGDGDIDIYVAQDNHQNRLWLNRGGEFEAPESIEVLDSEAGTVYLVKDGVSVTSEGDIIAAPDSQWNSVTLTAANTNASLSVEGLDGGHYHLYAADMAGNLSAVGQDITVIVIVGL